MVGLAGYSVLDELDKSLGIVELSELKVQALLDLSDVRTVLVLLVLEDHLLQEQECSLVINLLPHLHLSLPLVRCVALLAVVALQVVNDKLYNFLLLQQLFVQNFLLHGYLDLDSSGVRLSPDEVCVKNL